MKFRSIVAVCSISFLFMVSVINVVAENKNKFDIGDKESEHIGILALVNGSPVTLLDVLRLCGPQEVRLPYMYQGKMLEEQLAKVRLEALDEVINRKLVYGEFLSRKFTLPKSYVQMYLDKIAESYNVNDQKSLKELVESKGQNYDDFKEEAYESAAVNALISDRCYNSVYITPEQIYKYYKKHEKNFISPAQIEVQILKLKRGGIHRKELDSLSKTLFETFKNADKQTFDDAVLMYSEGPEVQNGGNIGWIEKDKLRKDFEGAINNSKKGDIVGPIKAEEGYYFLRINRVKPKVIETFKDAKENIRQKLTMDQKKMEYKNFINNLKEKATIKYLIDR
jgi:peptidyl-prolyl cis-trans isomerase SurA